MSSSKFTLLDIEHHNAKVAKNRSKVFAEPKVLEAVVIKKVRKVKSLLPKQSEHQLQCSCFEWFWKQYPQYRMRIMAIPNSGQRHIAVAAKMKREGQLAGAWDVFLAVVKHTEDGVYGGLWIELKVGNNTLTDNQKAFYEANKYDYQFQVCFDLEQFIYYVTEYLK